MDGAASMQAFACLPGHSGLPLNIYYQAINWRRENARKKDVRLTNIEAAKSVADVIRTSLGPRGMDKMVRSCAYRCQLASM